MIESVAVQAATATSRSTSASAVSFPAEPSRDPPTPASPNRAPAVNRTRPARQSGMMPINAVIVTSTSEVMVALFVPPWVSNRVDRSFVNRR